MEEAPIPNSSLNSNTPEEIQLNPGNLFLIPDSESNNYI